MRIKKQNLFRHRVCRHTTSLASVMIDKKSYLNFSSNDYLGLANEPEIKKTFQQAIDEYGVGSTASPAICGYTKAHRILEEQAAMLLNREACLLFNSGYHANQAIISSFANRHSLILADKDIHASLIDGAVLSRAKLCRFNNSEPVILKQLQKNHRDKHTLIVSESVFSMDGRLANLKHLCKMKQENKALLIIDDAHGFGTSNTCQSQPIDLISIPLGKAVGSMGGLVLGNKNMIESLHQLARSYRYSTTLPPAICSATSKSLLLIHEQTWRQAKLHDNIDYFIFRCKTMGINISNEDKTPIKSIITGDNQTTLRVQKKLKQAGIFISAIRPPTVAKHKSRIRISISSLHEQNDINWLTEQLARALAGEKYAK